MCNIEGFAVRKLLKEKGKVLESKCSQVGSILTTLKLGVRNQKDKTSGVAKRIFIFRRRIFRGFLSK